MKKRVLIPLLAVCLLAALLPATALAATASNVSYYNWNDSAKKLEEKTCDTATVVSSGDTTWGDDGNDSWYVVNSNVTIPSRIVVTGNVHLILMDDCTLTAKKGIQVQDNDDDCTNGSPNALTIYGQAGGTGGLTVPKLEKFSKDAAIGGTSGVTGACGTVTINGGVINVKGEFGAGIGGYADYSLEYKKYKAGGAGGRITINGGTVTATSGWGAGIGGGRGDHTRHGGIITINGGTVTASSSYGASIGGGQLLTNHQDRCDSGADVTISGGIVIATGYSGRSIGSGQNTTGYGIVNPGTFRTTADGNAVIFADSIHDKSDKANWHGVIFEGNTGKVYGGTVTPCAGFNIDSGKTLTIDSGNTLVNSHIIHVGGTVVNNGTVRNNGKIYVDGTFTGTAENLYYPLTLVKATAPNDIYSVYDSKKYAKVGTAGIKLTYDAPATGYVFDGWDVSPEGAVSIAADNTFTMPQAALTLTALYRDSIIPVISGIEDGKTYCAAPTVTVTDNVGVASVTVNGTEVTPASDGTFTLTPTNSTQTIVVKDAAGNETKMTVTVNDGHINPGHEPAKDATAAETGNIEYWYCKHCKQYFADAECKTVITQEQTIVGKLPPEIIAGMGQSILVGEKKALSFTSNAAYSDFIRVEIDGAGLDRSLYTVREGSTIVTLDADFVAALSAGEYTIGIVSESGTAETTFAVTVQLPQTGDSSRMALWLMLLLLSGGALAGVFVRKRRA